VRDPTYRSQKTKDERFREKEKKAREGGKGLKISRPVDAYITHREGERVGS